jgi:hypothetical protein
VVLRKRPTFFIPLRFLCLFQLLQLLQRSTKRSEAGLPLPNNEISRASLGHHEHHLDVAAVP